MYRRRALLLWLMLGLVAPLAGGQGTPPSAPAIRCPLPHEIEPQHLYGSWQAEWDGLAPGATLRLEPHPELTGSVRGSISRNGVESLLAGDVDDGQFTLEESLDGQHISATWLGSVVEPGCGQEIRGTWSNTSNPTAYPFVLRKASGSP